MVKFFESHLTVLKHPFDSDAIKRPFQILLCKNFLISVYVHLLFPFLIQSVHLST